ncbi:MAG: NAD(P)/FAD-dependent oxidoreductase, partial [Gammaproteobacteria bacterium]
MPGERLEIAVVGAGVSGLVTALRLAERHRVTIFEAEDYPGGHVHTIRVEAEDGIHSVDTGFIVFNRENYPRFARLLDELNITTQPSDMSLGVRCDASGIEWCGAPSPNRIFGQRRNLLRPAFYRMLADIARFARDARALPDDPTGNIGQFLRAGNYGRGFREWYLLPLGSALWSCSERDFAAFPLRFVIEFLDRHHLLDPIAARPVWRTISGGSRRYVDALLERFRGNLHLSTPVKRIRREPNRVHLATGDGASLEFDEVVLACQADQALNLLANPTPAETAILSAFPGTENEAILHTDTRVLARNRRCRSAWNVHRRGDKMNRLAVTYNMNILQRLDTRETYCVSLNETGIAPDKIIKRMRYRHPRFTQTRQAAQARRDELLRANRTSFCGAWWGFGFHEDGVESADTVAAAFG